MPYANNQGVRIHYEVEGDGPPLVLLHGFGNTLEMWYDSGHVESLKNDYRLILIDARGHGASEKPHDPEAYKMELMVTDVVAVLNSMYPPRKGAMLLPTYVADVKRDMRSPRCDGNDSAIDASATGTKIAVANPW